MVDKTGYDVVELNDYRMTCYHKYDSDNKIHHYIVVYVTDGGEAVETIWTDKE